MRLWSVGILPHLPDLQFRGQLRELIAIMHEWRDKGKTNHLLINKVMEYDKQDLLEYFLIYNKEYFKRYNKSFNPKYNDEFYDFARNIKSPSHYIPYKSWINTKEHTRVEMANLYEKHYCAESKSRISDEDWDKMEKYYKDTFCEDYKI